MEPVSAFDTFERAATLTQPALIFDLELLADIPTAGTDSEQRNRSTSLRLRSVSREHNRRVAGPSVWI